MKRARSNRAFTLVELMMVIAVISVLATMAIPAYREMRLQAARSELNTNVAGIKVAQSAYAAAFSGYVDVPSIWPTAPPARTKRTWDTGSAFDELGWYPDGMVYGSYTTTTLSTDFDVNGYSDLDGNGTVAQVTASLNVEPIVVTPLNVY
jgi:prepilin-type N-terminal cleavage/methylation domain-containing protein